MAAVQNTDVTTYQMYIGGRWVDASNGETSEILDPSTEEVFARVPKATVADAETAVRAAREAFDHGPWPRMKAVERGEILRRAAAADPRARRRAGAPREPADGQALLRGDRRHERRGPHLRLLRRPRVRGTRRDARSARRDHEHGRARAGRRHRRHHAVELPDAHGRLEGRAVAGGRQRHDPQAGLGQPADQSRAGADLRGGRSSRGRLPGHHRARRRDRRLPRRLAARRHGGVHRLGRGRQAHHAQGRRQREEGRPRAGRQEPQHRLRRRRLRGRHRRRARRHLRRHRRGLLGGLAPHRGALRSTTASSASS